MHTAYITNVLDICPPRVSCIWGMYQASIEGVTVADYIQRFEIEKVSEEDTTEIVANKLAEYYGKTETPFFEPFQEKWTL